MKNFLTVLLLSGVLISSVYAEMKCGPGKCGAAMMKQEVKSRQTKTCAVCGMKLKLFPWTTYIAKVSDKTKYYCSIHCLVNDMKSGSKPSNIRVRDAETLKFIDASKAYYVINPKERGTMSLVSKKAFLSRKTAEKLAKKYGVEVASFDQAIKEAQKDFSTQR